jgi:hypothetical protein
VTSMGLSECVAASIGRHASAGVLLAICRYSLGRCWDMCEASASVTALVSAMAWCAPA